MKVKKPMELYMYAATQPKHFETQDPEYGQTEMSNRIRADFAAKAVASFGRAIGVVTHDGDVKDGFHELVADLLCDLRHWCDGHGVDFEEASRNGFGNYEYESNPARFGETGSVTPVSDAPMKADTLSACPECGQTEWQYVESVTTTRQVLVNPDGRVHCFGEEIDSESGEGGKFVCANPSCTFEIEPTAGFVEAIVWE